MGPAARERREKGESSAARPWPRGLRGRSPLREAPSRRKRSMGVTPGVSVGGDGPAPALVVVVGPRPFRRRSPPAPGGVPADDARPASPPLAAPWPARPGSVPAPAAPPRLASPWRGGRLGPRPSRACAAAPRGCVPRRRPAGRRGVVCRRARFPPCCGRAAPRFVPAPEPVGGGRGGSHGVVVSRLRGGGVALAAGGVAREWSVGEARVWESVGSGVEGGGGGGRGGRGATAGFPPASTLAFHAARRSLPSAPPLPSPRPPRRRLLSSPP